MYGCGGCVWLETANAGQMLQEHAEQMQNNAARHFHPGRTGCGIYKLIGCRLLRKASLLPL